MNICIRHTTAKKGSAEHYRHYREEYLRLSSLLAITPIKNRSELAFNVSGAKMIIEEYEDIF